MGVVYVNRGDSYWKFDTAKVEKLRNCVYVTDLAARTRDGGWSETPISVFWQEKLADPSHSHYFGLYRETFLGSEGRLLITNASSAVEGDWDAVQAASGEVIFSRWRHDYRTSADGTAMVDGGRDYFRFHAHGLAKLVKVKLDGPDFVLVEQTSDDAGP